MLNRHKPRSRRVLYAFRTALVLFGCYLVFHAFYGAHGLLAYGQLHNQIAELETRKIALEERRALLEARVDALKEHTLDGDLVDERARANLALIGIDERIVLD